MSNFLIIITSFLIIFYKFSPWLWLIVCIHNATDKKVELGDNFKSTEPIAPENDSVLKILTLATSAGQRHANATRTQ